MDKIYSRNRIKIPQFRYYKGDNLIRKIVNTLLILFVAFLVMFNILKAIDPMYTEACKSKAQEVVTIEVNKITTENILKYKDSDMINIVKDENGNIQLLQVNSTPLNNMISEITNKIQESLSNNDIINTGIPFGSITGIRYISGIGPKIPIKISLVGTIDTKIRNEFDDAGINQTIHRLWLDIRCKLTILTPYKVEDTEVTSEIVLSENVIIGGVPNVYMNTGKE